MKRFLTFILLLGMACGVFAQKSYVTVYCCMNNYNSAICLSGDIPSDMQDTYFYYDFGSTTPRNTYFNIGTILNLLTGNGFEVDKMNSVVDADGKIYTTYLLSRSSGGQGESTRIRTIGADNTADTDAGATEVARYNLQGLPVKETDKGLHIIVYSNYTTKTVLVQ